MRSAIDFVMVDNIIYDRYVEMIIDEERERCDLSDHCLLEVIIRGGREERRASSTVTLRNLK